MICEHGGGSERKSRAMRWDRGRDSDERRRGENEGGWGEKRRGGSEGWMKIKG